MKITTEIFEKSFFSIGGGYDIEPLLRFSHLTDFFICVNLFLEKDNVIDWYDKMFKYCDDIEVLDKIIINKFDEEDFFELNENYISHLTNPDFIPKDMFNNYQSTFSQAIHLEQYAVIYTLYRKSVDRKITFYFCTAEGIASYLALSHNGKFAPRILSTIETGVLEHPEGILNTLFSSKSKTSPFLWIKGFEPRYAPFRLHNDSLDTIGTYKNKVLDFNSKWFCGWSYHPRQRKMERYCKGFVNDESLSLLSELSLKDDYLRDKDHFLFEPLYYNSSEINDIDCLIISKKTKLNLANANCNLLFWEDFTSNHSWLTSVNTVLKQINQLSEELIKMNLTPESTLHIIPFCNEDQGVQYYNSLKQLNFKTVTYLPNLYDFLDLKKATNKVYS